MEWPTTIGGYVPMSAQMVDDAMWLDRALAEQHRLDSIGPRHHPDRSDLPRGVRLLLELKGRPAGRVKRCTGITATWCPIHGDCTCEPDFPLDSPGCPLHDMRSTHAVRL